MTEPGFVNDASPSQPIDVVVGLGSNLGDRIETLRRAVRALAEFAEVRAVSYTYETPPLGPPQPDFMNAAVRLHARLSPTELLARLLEIERAEGRERRVRWGPRTLDLDILWIFGRSVAEPHLVVPHAELKKRAFALLPLLDVAPEAV
ncbi:MAG TPA: 2-amino-4-hydroxy-6-hydroxymethyldihydropteridine diphosphokinase, partial [Polyangiaceae bacterium]|nr:2-amino-4-hydroxy-6-hydroxymethyldihydropteridine diphosphokinase [Polyangiaceae bacterium]